MITEVVIIRDSSWEKALSTGSRVTMIFKVYLDLLTGMVSAFKIHLGLLPIVSRRLEPAINYSR